jgi:hypothetical protein
VEGAKGAAAGGPELAKAMTVTGWRKPKARVAGPYGWWPDRPKAAWVAPDGSSTPNIGGGRTALRRAYAEKRAEAYERMVTDVSNRWHTHRCPARPSGEGGT